MAEEKPGQDIEQWKKKVASLKEGLDQEIPNIPREVVFELVKDPEVGPRLSEAINRTMRRGRTRPPSPDEEGGVRKSDAAETAERARREHEQREEQKQKEEQEKRLSMLARIQRMDVGEKAKLAREGDKEARAILIKEGNKSIAMSVLANPRITSQEIEMIAASRNVNEDILREIAGNKDWTKLYTVMLNLCNNPKTPVGITLTYLPRLLTRDLRFLAKSKGVPEVIRVTARKMAQKRSI
jgi:hypothetical protein